MDRVGNCFRQIGNQERDRFAGCMDQSTSIDAIDQQGDGEMKNHRWILLVGQFGFELFSNVHDQIPRKAIEQANTPLPNELLRLLIRAFEGQAKQLARRILQTSECRLDVLPKRKEDQINRSATVFSLLCHSAIRSPWSTECGWARTFSGWFYCVPKHRSLTFLSLECCVSYFDGQCSCFTAGR